MTHPLTKNFNDSKGTIFVIRHAESTGQINPDDYKTIGDQKLKLTETGTKQAIRCAEFLKSFMHEAKLPPPDIIYSLCQRTKDTAYKIATHIKYQSLKSNSAFNKQKFGQFNGLLTKEERFEQHPEAAQKYEEAKEQYGRFNARPPQGESIADTLERVSNGLDEFTQKQSPTIIITHGLQILCIEKTLIGHSNEWILQHQDEIPNTSIKLFQKTDTGYTAENIYPAP